MAKDEGWGWTSYRRTGWVSKDDPKRRQYIARFVRHYTGSSEVVWVAFWARRPVLALRAICEGGKDPAEFRNEEVN